MMQKSIIRIVGKGEYLAHDFHGNLIATLKEVNGGFEIYHYGGKQHGKITNARLMTDVVSTLTESLATIYKHECSFLSESYGPCEKFTHDGTTYALLLTGIMAGVYFGYQA